ncbi:MAG: hypothetical protein AB7F31_03750 [Parachlamydiales bacterium]
MNVPGILQNTLATLKTVAQTSVNYTKAHALSTTFFAGAGGATLIGLRALSNQKHAKNLFQEKTQGQGDSPLKLMKGAVAGLDRLPSNNTEALLLCNNAEALAALKGVGSLTRELVTAIETLKTTVEAKIGEKAIQTQANTLVTELHKLNEAYQKMGEEKELQSEKAIIKGQLIDVLAKNLKGAKDLTGLNGEIGKLEAAFGANPLKDAFGAFTNEKKVDHTTFNTAVGEVKTALTDADKVDAKSLEPITKALEGLNGKKDAQDPTKDVKGSIEIFKEAQKATVASEAKNKYYWIAAGLLATVGAFTLYAKRIPAIQGVINQLPAGVRGLIA